MERAEQTENEVVQTMYLCTIGYLSVSPLVTSPFVVYRKDNSPIGSIRGTRKHNNYDTSMSEHRGQQKQVDAPVDRP